MNNEREKLIELSKLVAEEHAATLSEHVNQLIRYMADRAATAPSSELRAYVFEWLNELPETERCNWVSGYGNRCGKRQGHPGGHSIVFASQERAKR